MSNSSRQGEESVLHTRTQRFFRKGTNWYFSTREGNAMGPYADKSEAQLALAYFVERTQWPTAKQLRDYIRGGLATPLYQ